MRKGDEQDEHMLQTSFGPAALRGPDTWSFFCAGNGGDYEENATATLTATPNAGYTFVKWDDGVKDNPRTVTVTASATYTAIFEEVPQNEAKVTFENASWVAANAVGIDYTSDNYITFYFFKVANSTDDIYCNGFLECVPVSGATYESTGGDIMHYRDPNHIFVDDEGLIGNPGTAYWGYNSLSNTFVENITAVDLNALTISGNWAVEVGEVAEYAQTGQWTTTHNFTGKLTNATWTMEQPSGKASTKRVKTNTLATVK